LPTVLQLDTMLTHVEQVTIAIERVTGPPEAQSGVVPASSIPRGEAMNGIVEGAEPTPHTLRYSEDKPLKRLLAQLAALSHSEKALLTWLLEHDGTEIWSQDLADAVGMDVRVTSVS